MTLARRFNAGREATKCIDLRAYPTLKDRAKIISSLSEVWLLKFSARAFIMVRVIRRVKEIARSNPCSPIQRRFPLL